MDQEVEEVSFLPGEAILNKKSVYEPSKGQRFRQIVCTRPWALCILVTMGAVMVIIALIAAFARPASFLCANGTLEHTSPAPESHKPTQTYIATNGEPFPWKNLRLPDDVIPEEYRIFLHTNISLDIFHGKVEMKLTIVKPTSAIIFNSKSLNISDVTLKLDGQGSSSSSGKTDSSNVVQIVKQLEYVMNQQYYVEVSRTLAAGTRCTLSMGFKGSLAGLSRMNGFYKSDYTVRGEKRYMASTQFQPMHAREAFPCMDEPQLKANFSMTMVRDKEHITLFNTPLLRTTPYQDGLVLDEYVPTVKMSTYLVAYVLCDFKNISKTTKDGVEVRMFAPEDKIYMGQYALDSAVTVLECYDEFFGVAYPLPKLDLIGIPNFAAGAMENWGLVTYRETAILYDPKVSSSSSKQWVTTVVAHELAHQWFGNLVTLKWWNDLWLNEGFASYVEFIGADEVDKDFHMVREFEGRPLPS